VDLGRLPRRILESRLRNQTKTGNKFDHLSILRYEDLINKEVPESHSQNSRDLRIRAHSLAINDSRDFELRSIVRQEKHRVHESGPLSQNVVDHSSRKSKRRRNVIESSRLIIFKGQSKGSIDLAFDSLIFI
jgi:hypothetical protein